MVMTILEAHVAEEMWAQLKQSYEGATGELPSQMVQTYLLQSAQEPALWRVASVWKSREALQQYRASVETPGGVLLFRSVGAEPVLSIYDVAVYAAAAG
jgi:heme-degrading monooxygenase HmoA